MDRERLLAAEGIRQALARAEVGAFFEGGGSWCVVHADEDAVFDVALADAKIADLTSGKNVVKKIYVPGRMVNLVVK